MKNEASNLTKVALVITVIVLVVAFYSFLVLAPENKKLRGDGDFLSDNNYAEIGGDFILKDCDGNIFDSRDNLSGYSMIYFGFTFCPDVCPAALDIIKSALATLDKYKISTKAIFITIDPKRDQASSLKEFLAHFDNRILGLTGSEEEIRQVADKFKVYYAKDDEKKDDYLFNHSSFIYIFKDGIYQTHFGINSKPIDIANYIRQNS